MMNNKFFFAIIITVIFLLGNLDRGLSSLQKKLDQGNLNDVLREGEKIKEENPNLIPLRKLLLQTYLEKGFFASAQKELNFILKWDNSIEKNYWTALFFFYEKKYSEAITILNNLLKKNSQLANAYWLKGKIFFEQDKFSLAQESLEQYLQINGRDHNWYQLELALLLAGAPQIELPLIRQFLDEYRNSFLPSHSFFFLESQYFILSRSWTKALNSINQAIFLKENYFLYIQKKLEILFLSNKWKSLLKFVAEQNFKNIEETTFLWRLEAMVNLLKLRKKDSFFQLKNKNNLKKVIIPLEKIIIQNENDEWTRFFLEELILANTTLKDSLRKKYSRYHYRRGKFLQSRGNTEKVQEHFRRGLKLNGNDFELRSAYINFLKSNNRLHDYQEALIILKNLQRESDYKLDAQIEILEKKLQNTFYQTGGKNFSPHHQVSLYVVLENQDLKTEFMAPYYQVVLANLLVDKLERSFILRPQLIWSREKRRVLRGNNLYNNNFFVHFKARDTRESFYLNFNVQNFQKKLNDFFLTAKGNQRYQKVLGQFKIAIENQFLPQGEVVEVSRNKIIISLGRLHGVQVGDIVQILRNKQLFGKLRVTKIEDYFSEIDTLDFKIINSIRKRDIVQVIK